MTLALANSHRRLLTKRSEPMDVKEGPATCLSKIISLIYTLLGDAGVASECVAAIGMGVLGPVEFHTGLLNLSATHAGLGGLLGT